MLILSLCANTATFAATPFAGIDFQEREMRFGSQTLEGLFRTHAFQYDPYIGIRTDHWGIDFGYFAKKNKSRTLAWITTRGDQNVHYTEIKLKGPHIDLLGFYSLFAAYEIECFAGLGLVYGKLLLHDALIEYNHHFLTQPPANTYSVKRLYPRVLAGLQGLLYARMGIRSTVAWENTHAFHDLIPDHLPLISPPSTHNSWIYSIGIYTSFFSQKASSHNQK